MDDQLRTARAKRQPRRKSASSARGTFVCSPALKSLTVRIPGRNLIFATMTIRRASLSAASNDFFSRKLPSPISTESPARAKLLRKHKRSSILRNSHRSNKRIQLRLRSRALPAPAKSGSTDPRQSQTRFPGAFGPPSISDNPSYRPPPSRAFCVPNPLPSGTVNSNVVRV